MIYLTTRVIEIKTTFYYHLLYFYCNSILNSIKTCKLPYREELKQLFLINLQPSLLEFTQRYSSFYISHLPRRSFTASVQTANKLLIVVFTPPLQINSAPQRPTEATAATARARSSVDLRRILYTISEDLCLLQGRGGQLMTFCIL